MTDPQNSDTASTASRDPESGQSNFPKRFLFVTDDTTTTRRDVKAHATREYRRQQRWRDSNTRLPRIQVKFTWGTKQCSLTSSRTLADPSKPQARPSSLDKNAVCESNLGSASSRSWRSSSATTRKQEKLLLTTASSSDAQKGHSLYPCPHAGGQQLGKERPAHALQALALRCSSPHPFNNLARGNSDPFAAASVPIDCTVNQLMQWSQAWYVRSLWPAEASAHEQSSAVVVWREDMKEAIGDEACFHAALAVASNYMAHTHSGSPANPALLRQGLWHRGLSLASVGRRLRHNMTDLDMVRAIAHLGGADFYAGDLPATLLHLEAAKHIADAAGGLAKVNESLRGHLGIADAVTSWLVLRRPIFPAEDWDPGPWCKQGWSHCYSLDTATPSHHASMRSIWGCNHQIPNVFLRDILAEFNEMVLVRNLAISIDHGKHRNEIFRWLHLRRSAIKTHLLHHYLDLLGATQPLDTSSALAAAVCLVAGYCHGLIVYRSPTIDIHFPVRLLHTSLESAVLQSESGECLTNLELRLWLYFVGGMAEKLSGQYISDDKKRIFTVRFLAVAKKLELQSWQDIRVVLRLFLYDSVLDNDLEALTTRSSLISTHPEEAFSRTLAAVPLR